jgi:tetratricopeptide (TPR) repeat protein
VFFKGTHASFFNTLFLTLALAGCARKSTGPDRLAVVPFENLSSESELGAAGRGAATALVYDLAGAPNLFAETVQSMNGSYDMHASRILEGYFSESGGRVDLYAVVENAGSLKAIESIELVGPSSGGVLSLVNQLAARLYTKARTFEAGSPAAFRAYGQALITGDRPAALQALENATKADPRFTAAYVDRARLLLEQGERSQAEKLLQTAQGAHPDPIDQARLDYLAASIARDANRQEQALRRLTQVTATDPRVFRELGEIELRRRDYSAAAGNYEKAAQLNPDEPRGWNELGYVLAYADDLAGARRALEQYQKSLPKGDANALDSLGEVSFYLGDFAEAEKRFLEANHFLETNGQNRREFGAELVKAAEARLMTGDLKEADALLLKSGGGNRDAQHFRGAYQFAQWEFLTGRRKAAMEGLERILPALDPDTRSVALCQLSIWKLQTGDHKASEELSRRAVDLALSQGARSLSALCRAVAAPGASTGSRIADAYALLFVGKFSEATPLLESLYRETSPLEDAPIRTLLAWAYVETGRASDASRLLRIYPLPLSSSEPIFASMIFPRYLFLRGAVLEKQGQRAEAKRNYELFLNYAGDVPDIFGDQAEARRNLGSL